MEIIKCDECLIFKNWSKILFKQTIKIDKNRTYIKVEAKENILHLILNVLLMPLELIIDGFNSTTVKRNLSRSGYSQIIQRNKYNEKTFLQIEEELDGLYEKENR